MTKETTQTTQQPTSNISCGVVLSGGGARGIAHLGVLKAFDEVGITIAGISGTSAGAIVGALYAYGHQPDDILQIIKKTNFLFLMRPSLSLTGLLDMDRLEKYFLEYLPDSFSALKIPVVIAATNLIKGETVFLSEGHLIKAVLASACIPVIFKPYEIDGVKYIDGGLLNNLPVEPLLGQHDVIIGVHTNPIHDNFTGTNAKNILERSLLMAISGNTKSNADRCDYYIEPPELGRYAGMDISKADELFEIGYRYTMENIDNFEFLKD